MKKLTIILIAWAISMSAVWGQEDFICGTHDHGFNQKDLDLPEELKNRTPNNINNGFCLRSWSGSYCSEINDYETSYDLSTKETKYIPVVFHLLKREGNPNGYNDEFSNMWSVLHETLEVTNKYFAGKATEMQTGNISPLEVDSKIRFVLANEDSEGNCSSGIIHHYLTDQEYASATSNLGYLAHVNSYADNVMWDVSKYINVFVIHSSDMGEGPIGASGKFNYFSHNIMIETIRGTTKNDPYEVTLAHEFGHFLGLQHTFEHVIAEEQPLQCYGWARDNPATTEIDHAPATMHTCWELLPPTTTLYWTSDYAPDNKKCSGDFIADIPLDDEIGNSCSDAGYFVSVCEIQEEISGFPGSALNYYLPTTIPAGTSCGISYPEETIAYYNPDRNIMSYSDCRYEFSPDQIMRMHWWTENFMCDIVYVHNPQSNYPLQYSYPLNDSQEIDYSLMWDDNTLHESGIITGPTDATPYVVSGYEVWDCNKTVIGEVVVASGGQLKIEKEAEIQFWDKNSGITVQPGGVLEVNTAVLKPLEYGCDGYWHGIVAIGLGAGNIPLIDETSTINDSHPYHGVVILKKAWITNAKYGLQIGQQYAISSPYSNHGGAAYIERSTFANCEVGILQTPYYGIREKTFVKQSNFIWNNNYVDKNSPTYFKAGISIGDNPYSKAVFVWDSRFDNSSTLLDRSNMIGIQTQQNVKLFTLNSNYGASDNLFRNLGYGIYSFGSGGSVGKIYARHNDFIDNRIATSGIGLNILSFMYNYARIAENQSSLSHGLIANNSALNWVAQNSFEGKVGATAIDNGIYLYNNTQTVIVQNEFNGPLSRGIYNSGTEPKIKVNCNMFLGADISTDIHIAGGSWNKQGCNPGVFKHMASNYFSPYNCGSGAGGKWHILNTSGTPLTYSSDSGFMPCAEIVSSDVTVLSGECTLFDPMCNYMIAGKAQSEGGEFEHWKSSDFDVNEEPLLYYTALFDELIEANDKNAIIEALYSSGIEEHKLQLAFLMIKEGRDRFANELVKELLKSEDLEVVLAAEILEEVLKLGSYVEVRQLFRGSDVKPELNDILNALIEEEDLNKLSTQIAVPIYEYLNDTHIFFEPRMILEEEEGAPLVQSESTFSDLGAELSEITVYPNPSTGIVFYENRGDLGIKSIRVIDMNSGKNVMNLSSGELNADRSIDISKLKNGVYTLSFSTEGGKTFHEKVVIVK